MDVAYISALAALAGSVVGSLTSGITTWLNQRAQARAGLRAHEASRREDLFTDFIVAASKPQDRAAFLVGLALWGAACALLATLLRNFAAYATTHNRPLEAGDPGNPG
jgi:hypothetical protein